MNAVSGSLTGQLLLAAILLSGLSGLPSLATGRHSNVGQRIGALLSVAGSMLGLASALWLLPRGAETLLDLPWALPGGRITLESDSLSAAFLLPIFLVSGLGAIYGLGYWPQSEHPSNGRKLRLFYGLLTASMAVVVLARNGILFLMAWEAMALAAFFLATTEDQEKPVRDAGWVYLIATHTGTLCLLAMVSLLGLRAGSLAWAPLGASAGRGAVDSAIFLLALVGFGFKAGILPLHFWLPSAHANAPSHVSAMMSGVMLKAGVYGVLRICSLFPHPPGWWGELLLVVAVATAVFGIALAAGQGDIKRLLAYSSIENIGIIFTGLGLALLGKAAGQPRWALLGLAGCVLHVWNHSVFKSLLFFGAGSVIHATGTRDMSRLGGLLKKMPWTAAAFATGALAVCGLPPLNGFASEWLVYLGLFSSWTQGPLGPSFIPFAAAGLAAVGAIAVAAFVKLLGVVFLGQPRSAPAGHAHEPGATLLVPMGALALGCLLLGSLPLLLAPALDSIAYAWEPSWAGAGMHLADIAPLGWLAAAGLLLLALVCAVALAFRALARNPAPPAPTWDCGYARPSARMQYTSASFGEWISERLLPSPLRPAVVYRVARGIFLGEAELSAELPDPLSAKVYEPFFDVWAGRFARLRRLQQGYLSFYLIYILAALLVLFTWATLRDQLGGA